MSPVPSREGHTLLRTFQTSKRKPFHETKPHILCSYIATPWQNLHATHLVNSQRASTGMDGCEGSTTHSKIRSLTDLVAVSLRLASATLLVTPALVLRTSVGAHTQLAALVGA